MTETKSESGRTEVDVELDEFGKGLIVVQRDGRIIHRFDVPEEQLSIDTEPRVRTG